MPKFKKIFEVPLVLRIAIGLALGVVLGFYVLRPHLLQALESFLSVH